jgi:hypothetical protein
MLQWKNIQQVLIGIECKIMLLVVWLSDLWDFRMGDFFGGKIGQIFKEASLKNYPNFQ